MIRLKPKIIPIVYRVESQVKDPGFWPGFVFNEFMWVYNQFLTSSYLLGLQLQPAASILACQDLVKLAPRLVNLAGPSVSSSLQISNGSFTYASPYLWNQLPSSFRQPHSVHCKSWFTSSCTYHLITVTTFTPITYHCLYISLQT